MSESYIRSVSTVQSVDSAKTYGKQTVKAGQVKHIPPYKTAGSWNLLNSPNRVRIYQEIFKLGVSPDPVFLRGGFKDLVIYRGVMGFSVIGLSLAFFGIYKMATGTLVKKGAT